LFFFEKKNQKTFANLHPSAAIYRPSCKGEQAKAFCFFFSKRKAFLPSVGVMADASARRIAALDGLRGVSALLVLFHHMLLMLPDFANVAWRVPAAGPHGPVEWLLLRTPLRLLWAGQERALLFFVLSGFVLAVPWLAHRPPAYGRFLLNRLCRIYPPYIVAMALAALGSTLLGGHALSGASVYFNALGWAFQPIWAAVPSLVFVLNTPASEYMNEAVWSLVWEVRVALLFPLLILPIVRWRLRGVVLALAATLLLRHVATLLMPKSLSAALNQPQESFYYAAYFIFGAGVAACRPALLAWFARRHRASGLGVLLLGLLICWYPWPLQHDRMVGVGAAIIIAAIVGDARLGAWFSAGWLLWLGRRSYSLYLTHLLVVMSVIIACGGRVPLWACAAVLPVALVVADLFQRGVEAPSIRWAQVTLGYTRRA
jgi:peptidoglycan/LPS O-acetylase OafA/YrhL